MKRKNFADEAFLKTMRSRNIYETLLTEIALSRFEWVNLPETIDEDFLERTLYFNAGILFFKDEVLNYLTLPFRNNQKFNVYGVPTEREAYAPNKSGYYRKSCNENDSVIIYSNYLKKPEINTIRNFSEDLAQLEQIISINCNAQKTPVVILADENQRLTMLNLLQQYAGNVPFVFGDKKLSTKDITALNLNAPFVADKLYELKTNIWNEALTFLGIPNISINKKERMIKDEVTKNQGGTFAARSSPLIMRKNACKKINKMFGLNIDVRFRNETPEEENNKGGDDNE